MPAPTNQDTVMGSSNKRSRGDQAVSITSPVDSTLTIWFAPIGTSTFTADGTTITSTPGDQSSINAPSQEGTYYLYVRNNSGETSNASTRYLTVDNTAPTTQNLVLATTTNFWELILTTHCSLPRCHRF